MKRKTQPKDMNLYRAQLSCKIAMEALDTRTDAERIDYALYNLCSAIAEIAKHLEGAKS